MKDYTTKVIPMFDYEGILQEVLSLPLKYQLKIYYKLRYVAVDKATNTKRMRKLRQKKNEKR